MKRKILLPTDFSTNASQAIRYALELFKNEECLFYFLNVFYINATNIESLMGMEPGSELYESTKAKSENKLHELLNTHGFGEKGNPNHSFQVISTFGEPLHVIKKLVEEKAIDLIIMGTRGETNVRGKIYGSIATEIMEKIKGCPIIVVPQLAKQELPKEIVFPTGFKSTLKNNKLSCLVDIATICEASVKVLHVSEDGKLNPNQAENKALLESYFQKTDHTFHFLSNNLSVPATINCFVESRESDMVAFMNRKHSFFKSILNQPLVKGIAFTSKVPILVMHE